jgi:putative transposase
MTLPRRILPNISWFITRRCAQRCFFLLPTPFVKQVFEYALARTARESGILLHGWLVMSDHYHLVLTDPHGRLPEFQKQLNSLIARILNHHYERSESFWSPGSYNAVELLTEDAVLDKLVYTLSNPVSAGLVREARQWSGSSSVDLPLGLGLQIERPAFLRDGEPVETLRATPPLWHANAGFEPFEVALHELLRARENEVRADFACSSRGFLGMHAVMARAWTSTASSPEPRGLLRPRFAALNCEILQAAIADWKIWLASYRQAWEAFCGKARDVVFPAGTYSMRVLYAVEVADGPDPPRPS